MKYKKFLMAGLVAVGSLALAAQDGQTIERTLVENSVDTYKISSKVAQTVKSSQFGEMPMTITSGMTYKLKTIKVDVAKGSADVEATTSVDSIDGGDSPLGSQLNNAKPAPIVQDGTIDKYGHLILNPPTGGDPMVTMMMGASGSMQSALFIELPDHAVKVGDSWDIVIPKGSFTGDADQKITAKLTGDQKVDGKDAWTVDLSGTINIQFDSAKLPTATDNGTPNALAKYHIIVKGSTTMTGTGTVDKATGKTLTLSTTGTMKSNLEMPDQGDITADVSGTVGTDVKLQN